MKKKISLLLFIIPLLMFPLMNVGANEVVEMKKITLVKAHSKYKIKFNDANNQEVHHGSFFEIELDNQVALCLDPNHHISQGSKYHMVGKIMNDGSDANSLLIQAYLYAIANKNNLRARAAAQIVAWKWGRYETTEGADEEALIQGVMNGTIELKAGSLINALRDGLRSFASNEEQALKIAAREYINIKYYTSIPSDIEYLGIWQDYNTPNNQRVLALPDKEEEEKLEKENCKQVTFNGLMGCYGDGNYTNGGIYQQTVGDCKNYYDKKTNNKYSTYGIKDTDFGTYCRMYCNKSYNQMLPGNIATVVNVGRYIVWPNNNIENNRYKINANLTQYPMELTLTKSCHIGLAYSDDTNKYQIETDYQTAYGNYINYINSTRDSNNRLVYNQYKNDNYSCKPTYENTYKALKEDADDYCNNKVGEEPTPATVKTNPHECCSGPGRWVGGVFACPTTTCYDDVETQEHKDWKERVNTCNEKKKAAETAYSNLEKCEKISDHEKTIAGIIEDFNSCVGYNANINLNFSVPGISVSYNDEEYGTTMGLKETYVRKTCTNCTSSIAKIPAVIASNATVNLTRTIQTKINAISSKTIIGVTTKKYDLANGYYYFVNKDTNKAISTLNTRNYSIIGFSNMPISYKANPKKNYDLKVNMPSITGDASVFSKEIASNNYVCHYKVTKTTSPSCVCPEGTLHAGESLDCLSKNNNGTCLDNQEQFCNSSAEIPHNCTSSDLTCPNDPSMDLSACVNAGKTYNWCVNNFCDGKVPNPDNPDDPIVPGNPVNPNGGGNGNRGWVCPAGTNEGMDLSSCVIPMMIKGYSEKDAYEYCRDVTCPYGGIKIIYRVIDLANPFPSKDADSVVTQKGLKTGMFNDQLKGRYPGSNWNSTNVVKKRILNNRNVDGDEVYNKQPLYTFIVDSSKIKAIRKYNDAQRDSYADFKLNCLDGRTACKSDFVHNSIYGITGGTCKNVSKGSFYTCAN